MRRISSLKKEDKEEYWRLIGNMAEATKEYLEFAEKKLKYKGEDMYNTSLLIESVAEIFDISVVDMLSPRRKGHLVIARQFVFYFLNTYNKFTLQAIADIFQKNHATVLHGVRAITNFLETYPEYQVIYNRIVSTYNKKLEKYETIRHED